MTSKAYLLEETTIKVNGEAGADVALSAEGVTDGAGRVSAQKDWGASARAFMFHVDAEAVCQATPTQYETIDVYLIEAQNAATNEDGDVGNTDAALGDIDQLNNMRYIGSIVIEEADTSKMKTSFDYESHARYHQWCVVNNSGATLSATDSDFALNITPMSIQGQAT